MEDAYTREIRFWTLQATIGACVVFLAGTVFGVAVSSNLFQLRDWQTLLAGVIGAAVTLGSVLVVLFQIKSSKDQEEESRLRRNLSDRAHLAVLAINGLKDYETHCIAALVDIYSKSRNTPWRELAIALPEYPSELVSHVAAAVESADIEDAFRIGWISTQLQSQKSRLKSFVSQMMEDSPSSIKKLEKEMAYAVLHAFEISILVSDLSIYANGIRPIHRRSFDVNIYQSLLPHFGIQEKEWPEVYELARRNHRAEGEYRGKGKQMLRVHTV